MRDNRKYFCDENYFNEWSVEMAYFLGFIAADGHITSYDNKQNYIIINIVKDDEEVLERFKNSISYTGKIIYLNKKNGQIQSCLRVCSNKLTEQLKSHSLNSKKTYSLNWLNHIPDQYINHFMRGYFDGDGCVHLNFEKYNYSASLVGTENFMTGFLNYFRNEIKENIGSIKIYPTYTNLVFGGKYVAKIFLDWIYNESTENTRLKRKYNKYLEFINFVGDDVKLPNNSKINQEIANSIRFMHKTLTVKEISSELKIPATLIYDVVMNRTWIDESYIYSNKKSDKIYLEFNSEKLSIREWSTKLNIPYSTIDRRLRMNLPIEKVLSQEKRLKL